MVGSMRMPGWRLGCHVKTTTTNGINGARKDCRVDATSTLLASACAKITAITGQADRPTVTSTSMPSSSNGSARTSDALQSIESSLKTCR